jgi:hypothetical protein
MSPLYLEITGGADEGAQRSSMMNAPRCASLLGYDFGSEGHAHRIDQLG